MPLIIPNLVGFDWRDVRLALKASVEAIAPDANVHAEWKLEFDPNSSLGKVTGGMKGKNTHSTFVHSFMMGLTGEREVGNESGTFATVGGGTCDYILTFALWGFYDYKSWRVRFGSSEVVADNSVEKNATAFAEHERRALKAMFRMNPTLGSEAGRIRYVFPPVLENMDNAPFSNGEKILVVQNSVDVRVRESFA
jgi:hypothetical protein